MKSPKITALFCLATFLFFSCEDDKDEMNNMPATGNPVGIVENAHASGQTVSADFTGRITSQQGTPIAGAAVSAGGSVVFTDAQGFYQIEDAAVDGNYALLKVEYSGMFDQFRALKPRTDKTNYVDIAMIQKVINGYFSTASGGVINIPGGPTVSFPAGELVTSGGQPYSGEVLVASTYLDPSDPSLMSYMPGSLAAVDDNGEAVGMITYGMVGIELAAAANGQSLQLAGGRTATLTMPLPESHTAHAPASIPLWYFDEMAGIWQEEGVATRNGNSYVGEVSHFTFWNCDIAANTLVLEGTVLLDQEDNPMAGVKVKLTRPDGSYSIAMVDGSGYFQGIVPANEVFTLEVISGECQVLLHTEQIGPFAEDHDLGSILIDSSSDELGIVQFLGTVVDCDGNTVPGSVVVYSNSASNHNGYLTTDEAGSWSLALACMSTGSLSLTATSPDDFTQSNDYTILYDIVDNTVYDANSISLCDGEIVNTYMTYNDGVNEVTFTHVELIGFNPGTFGCSDFIVNNPGAESTDFISGLGLASLNSDSLNFSICPEDFQIRGYLASGEYLVLETPGGAESSWVEVIQHIEGDSTNLLEASFSLYFDTFIEDWPVSIYTDDSMTTLADEYNVQGTFITFLVLYE